MELEAEKKREKPPKKEKGVGWHPKYAEKAKSGLDPREPVGRVRYPLDEDPDDSQRQEREAARPQPPPKQDIANDYTPDKYKQQDLARPPIRAISIKGRELREAMRGGNVLDWSDIHERFVDLWMEARLVIWRAKHKRAGLKVWDPVLKKDVQGYVPDDKLVLEAIDITKGVLDSIIKLRREMGAERGGIPRWATERIEKALRDFPEAQQALLKELIAERDGEGKD